MLLMATNSVAAEDCAAVPGFAAPSTSSTQLCSPLLGHAQPVPASPCFPCDCCCCREESLSTEAPSTQPAGGSFLEGSHASQDSSAAAQSAVPLSTAIPDQGASSHTGSAGGDAHAQVLASLEILLLAFLCLHPASSHQRHDVSPTRSRGYGHDRPICTEVQETSYVGLCYVKLVHALHASLW